jgi:hypothetical protein
MLIHQDPTKELQVYLTGAVKIDEKTTIIERMVASPAKLRLDKGVGYIGIYIEGMQTNGDKSRFAIQLTSKGHSMRLNASVLNEILGIIVGIQSTENVKAVNVYANCKSATNRVKEA